MTIGRFPLPIASSRRTTSFARRVGRSRRTAMRLPHPLVAAREAPHVDRRIQAHAQSMVVACFYRTLRRRRQRPAAQVAAPSEPLSVPQPDFVRRVGGAARRPAASCHVGARSPVVTECPSSHARLRPPRRRPRSASDAGGSAHRRPRAERTVAVLRSEAVPAGRLAAEYRVARRLVAMAPLCVCSMRDYDRRVGGAIGAAWRAVEVIAFRQLRRQFATNRLGCICRLVAASPNGRSD